MREGLFVRSCELAFRRTRQALEASVCVARFKSVGFFNSRERKLYSQAKGGSVKNFLAIYLGSESDAKMKEWESLDPETRNARTMAAMSEWNAWVEKNKDRIVDPGGPIGKTKRITAEGISASKNLLAAYTVIQAESHDEAAKIFENHPHFMIFPGDAVEVMECLPIPTR